MKEIEQLIHLHASMIETITAAENRRQSYSTLAFSFISVGFAIIGSEIKVDTFYISIPIFIISCVWLASARFFSKLADAKWHVITHIEKKLHYQPYNEEWKHFNSNRKCYDIGTAKLDQIIPTFAVIFTFIFIVYSLCDRFS